MPLNQVVAGICQRILRLSVVRAATLDSITDGILILNPQNSIIDSNPAATRLIGRLIPDLSDSALRGQHAAELFSSWPQLAAYLQSESKEYDTLLQAKKKGVEFYLDVRVTPLYVDGNRFAGRLILLHDCTEREQTARALRERKEQLRQLAQELRSQERSGGQLLAGFGTEIRVPVNNIQSYLDQLAANDADAREHCVDALRIETSRLQHAVETMLERLNRPHVEQADLAGHRTYPARPSATIGADSNGTEAHSDVTYYRPDSLSTQRS